MKGIKDKSNIDKFKKRLNALKDTIIENKKKTCTIVAIIASMIISGYQLGKSSYDFFKGVEYYNVVTKSDDEIKDNNNIAIEQLLDSVILVCNLPSDIEQNYRFENDYLYDKNNNVVTLDNEEKPVSFIGCKINGNVLNNIDLVNSRIKELSLNYSNFDGDIVNYLPSSLEYLSLGNCFNITNLNGLGDRCPNIKVILLNGAVAFTDLSFIYELPNLEEFYFNDCPYVTKELLDYLKDNNIVTNIDEDDVNNSLKIDMIIDEIIKPNMSDSEKVQAICLYVLDNFEYDITSLVESNDYPLEYFLNEGKGVCISYAYLTNVLLNRASINSYLLIGDSHAWNLVELDNRYYYVDTSNMDGNNFDKMLLSLFNIASDYMIEPDNASIISAMSDVNMDDVMISSSLLYDVINKNSNKDIVEKYGNVLLYGSECIFSFLNIVMILYVMLRFRKLFNIVTENNRDIYCIYLQKIYNVNNNQTNTYAYYLDDDFNEEDYNSCFGDNYSYKNSDSKRKLDNKKYTRIKK